MSAFQEPRYDVSPLPSSPPRRIRRRVWVWAGFVLVSILIGALAGAGGVLLFGGFALLLVALVALVRPRWIGARTRAVAAAVAAIGLAGAISGTALAGTSAPGSGPTGVPSAVTTEPSQVPTTAPIGGADRPVDTLPKQTRPRQPAHRPRRRIARRQPPAPPWPPSTSSGSRGGPRSLATTGAPTAPAGARSTDVPPARSSCDATWTR